MRRLRELPGQSLALDGHNVLITLECADRGLPLVAADDGWVRDVGEVSRAFKVSDATDRVLTLVADYLADQASGPVEVFYDAPLSLSGELARRTREIFAARGLSVEAAAVPVPERLLSAFPGAIITSDTALIDAHAKVVDLAGEIIRRHPDWRLIPLGNLGLGRRDRDGGRFFPAHFPWPAKSSSKEAIRDLSKKPFWIISLPESNHGRLTQR